MAQRIIDGWGRGRGFIQNEDPDLPIINLKEGKPYRAIIFMDKK
jgi:hypothetical protein